MAVVAITGAGRGIGLELTRQHAEQGDKVYAFLRDPKGADALNAIVGQYQDLIVPVAMDVGLDASVKEAASHVEDQVDILYNVAGIVGPIAPELEESDWSAWNDVLNILLMAPLRVMQALLPKMESGSKVMNFSSQLAASWWPYGGFYAYGAAKAGLNRMMRSVAIDLKDQGIVVGLIHPGYVQTDMGGPGAEITPEESAQGVRAVAEAWTIEETGDFKRWNGEAHPL
ncbi:MAG: SDR family NAD(P)-dependent oxidoreductase [Parasphingorhabdus sp.]|uniref:SDR family NAD(P)-dependent oxidoreductase n=1 Tax=Parasphingorhabdus sp. TaxID=2709688 RepID=UPI0032991804